MAVTYDLAGRVAVVAGGAGEIGGEIADKLQRSGARVWVLDLGPIDRAGVTSLEVDVTDRQQVETALARIVGEAGSIEILVNSAGYLGGYGTFELLPPADWPRIVGVNLMGVLEICRAVVPHMRRTGWGRIVNIGSLAGKHGLPNMAVYSAASAGVIAFTKALAQEVAETDIRVNCVTPGPIATNLITRLGPAVVEKMIAASPMHRLGTVAEVADLVLWLCSDACSFTTGAIFDVSGGRAAY
jgi:NAD(P)-dependent dehydrogenase (short-subunit alcohol dehydrogenase family)